MPRLETDQTAPPFTLLDQASRSVSLSDFAGRNLIIFFYPAAMTPGCTKEACDFRDSLVRLQQAGYDVVGISPDKPEKLAQFVEKESLTYSLLSDPDRQHDKQRHSTKQSNNAFVHLSLSSAAFDFGSSLSQRKCSPAFPLFQGNSAPAGKFLSASGDRSH